MNGKKINIILANVGEGKSTYLAALASALDKNICYPIFYCGNRFGTDGKSEIAKIKRDINNSLAYSFGKKVIIFFDGIDELNPKIKREMKDFLLNLKGNKDLVIIIGSRKSEFEEFSNEDYNSIGFKELNNQDRENFINQRLEDIPDKDIKEKEIVAFINTGILDKELSNTPLIMFFLTQLVLEDKLKLVKNRAELYEMMTLMILEEHQGEKESSMKSIDGRDSEIIFDALGFCAYKRFCIDSLNEQDIREYLEKNIKFNNKSKKEDYINALMEQVFLIYRHNNGEFNFIIKSFEEYFLARALGSFEDGNLDILDFRRENENNITNWISLKPVIIFYCEVLFNNGEYSKLRNFLLKDLNDIDDIEGFFMGIEFIHRLHNMIESFDDKKKKEINDITHDIRLRITSWIICNKKVIELFQSFQKNIGYKPNIFVESYINNDKRKGKFKNKEEHDIEMSELLPVKINHNPKLFLNYRGNKFNDFKLHFLKENIYELYRNREKLDTQDLNKLCSLILDLEYNEEIYDLFLIFIIEKLKGYLEMGNIIGFFEKNKINNFNSIGKIKSPDILNYLFDAIKNNIKLNPTNLDNILLNLRLIGNEIMQNFIEKEIYQICKFNIRRSAFLLHYISKVDKNIFGNRCYIIFENCLDILELTDKFKLIKNSIIGSLEDANTFESKDILIRRFGITF